MSSHRSDESVVSYPSSFSDQEFHAFGGVSLDYTRSAADSDNNVKVPSPTSFIRMGAIHEAASSGIPAARRTLASAVVNRSAKIQDEERRNRLLDLVCLNFKTLEKQLENFLSRAEAKSQVAELESLTTSLKDRMTEIVSVNDQQAYPMQTPRVGAYVQRSLTIKTGFEDSAVLCDSDIDFGAPQRSNEGFLGGKKETRKEQDPAEDLDHMIRPHNTDLDETRDISSAQRSKQTLNDPDNTIYGVHTGLSRSRSLKEPFRPNNNNYIVRWLSMQNVSVNRGDPTFSNKLEHTASESNQNRMAANYLDNPHQDQQQTSRQQPCLRQRRNYTKTMHHRKQRSTRKQPFPQQSRNPATQMETRPTTDRPSSQDTALTRASSDTAHHDQRLFGLEQPFPQKSRNPATQKETRPTKDRSTSQNITRAEASSDITRQSEERFNLATYSHSEDKDTGPIRDQSVSRYSRGALTHSDVIYQDDQRPSREGSSGKSRRNTNYQDSEYKYETIHIKRKHRTHGRRALSDSHITHTDEKGDLGPSHERSHPANTSLITNKVTLMLPRQKSSPRHSGIPGKISHLEPTSKHDFYQMGESRFIYQETPRDRRSLQSNYDHMFKSTDVTTNLSRAQSQHNINQVPIDKDIVTDKSCQSAQGLLDISKAADDVVRERRENLRIIPQNIVKRMSIAFK